LDQSQPPVSAELTNPDNPTDEVVPLALQSPNRAKATRGSGSSLTEEWRRRWLALLEEPQTAERDKALMELIEALAAFDSAEAIALARGVGPQLRENLLQAALRGWGTANPYEAVAWARLQTDLDAGLALAAVFHGVTADPERALQLAKDLSRDDPAKAHDYGSYLIAGLNRARDFERAATFAQAGPTESRVDWMNAVFARWATTKPEAAFEHLQTLSDPELQKTALQAAVTGWADADPIKLAEFASNRITNRADRTFALSVALSSWAEIDPAAAANWMMQLPPSHELDRGAAELASHPEALQQPGVAVSWAESIVDARLRSSTLVLIVSEWAKIDPVAAQNYIRETAHLRAEDRAELLTAVAEAGQR
jgi:hypothetical protein